MTTTTTSTSTSTTTSTGPVPAAGRVTVGTVTRSELLKLRSLRSTVWTLVVAVLGLVGLGTLMAVGFVVQSTASDQVAAPPISAAEGAFLGGVQLALFAVATLGVLTVTAEYATGTIRAALSAVPVRSRLLRAKAFALALVVLPVTTLATAVAFVLARAVLAAGGHQVATTLPDAVRAVAGAGLYLTAVALLGAGFGWLVRSTAGGIACVVALFTVPSLLGPLLPGPVAQAVVPYLPDTAGTALMHMGADDGPSPWLRFAVFTAYVVAVLTVGVRALDRRDT